MPIKISVIIGVLNMKQSLTRSLESVIAQDYPHYEIIIMDGQSKDGTVDVILEYKKYLHYWQSQKDKGHIDACNQALSHVTGDFIFLLNADDTIAPHLFSEVAKCYKEHPEAKMISCGVQIYKDKQIINITSQKQLSLTLENVLFGSPLTNARFYHQDLFRLYGKFKATTEDGNYYISNDREFLTRLILNGVRTVIIPSALYTYHAHPASLTFGTLNLIKIHEEHIWLASSLLKKSLSKENTQLIKKWLARERIALMYFLIKGKRFIPAFFTLLCSLKENVLGTFYYLPLLSLKKILKLSRF